MEPNFLRFEKDVAIYTKFCYYATAIVCKPCF